MDVEPRVCNDLSMLCRSIASRGGAATPACPLLSVAAPLGVRAGCLSLRAACFLLYARLKPHSPRSRYTAGLLSLPRAQRGSVSQRLAKGCCLAPSPRPAQRVSRLAAGGGQGKRLGEFPILGFVLRPMKQQETKTMPEEQFC